MAVNQVIEAENVVVTRSSKKKTLKIRRLRTEKFKRVSHILVPKNGMPYPMNSIRLGTNGSLKRWPLIGLTRGP